LRGNCVLKHVIEGKVERRIDVTGRRGRGSNQLLGNKKVMESESTSLPFMENWLWKRPWTCLGEAWTCRKEAVDLLSGGCGPVVRRLRPVVRRLWTCRKENVVLL
jgi:hypothetical protein